MPNAPAAAEQQEQAKPQISRAELHRLTAEDLFLTAEEIDVKYTEVMKARQANRDSLRNMARQGHLSGEHRKRLNSLYPEREMSEETKAKRKATRERKAAEKAAAEKAKENQSS